MIEPKPDGVIQIIPANDQGSTSADDALIEGLSRGRGKKYVRFLTAALSSLPWVGGLIGASASLHAESDQAKLNELQRLWLEEHKTKVEEFGRTLDEIFIRLESFGDEVKERIESPEYLALVKRAFRSWDAADTDEKKQMFKKLITNAGAIKLCPDDLIRLFLGWIELYHEAHFLVIKAIYKSPGITRAEIWERIHGPRPREDSSDADLFRYLIRDLSTGGVIRQELETDWQGNFLKKDAKGRSQGSPSRTMESAFEDTKPYVLTELGKKFVHYVMEDVVRQVASGHSEPSGE